MLTNADYQVRVIRGFGAHSTGAIITPPANVQWLIDNDFVVRQAVKKNKKKRRPNNCIKQQR